MKNNWVFYLIVVFFLFGCTPKEKELSELSGDVFIVTKERQNIKLGLVEVSVIDSAEMNVFAQSRLQSAKQEIERIKPVIQKAQREYENMNQAKEKFYRVYLDNIYSHRYEKKYRDMEYALSKKRIAIHKLLNDYYGYSKGSYFLTGLPRPIRSVKTDSDGKFGLKLKSGRYAIVAHSPRKSGDSDKDYYWFIWVNLENDSKQRIFLSNDNLFESKCESCVFNISQLPY